MYIGGYPREFNYSRASTLDEALEMLAEAGEEGKVIAGGQSLMPMMRLRMSFITRLIDIYRIGELRYIKLDQGWLRIGALTAHQEIAMNVIIGKSMPMLTRAAWTIADLQVRNRGTIGGSLAHADPAANYLPALMVVDAELVIASKGSRRRTRLVDFMLDPYTTDIKPTELVVEVDVPVGKYDAFGYSILKRGGNAFPIVIAAAAVKAGGGVIDELRLGVGGMTTKPLLLDMDEMRGKSAREVLDSLHRVLDSRIDEAIKEVKTLSDIHASDKYRVKASKSFSAEAIRSALGDLS